MLRKIIELWLIVFVLCFGVVCVPRLSLKNDVSILRLSDCSLPCWIGIVPGRTTIGKAHRNIQQTYGAAFEVEIVNLDRTYSLAYVLKVSPKDQSPYLLVTFNDSATKIQDDTSIVDDITIYAYNEADPDKFIPAVIDVVLALGRPSCLAPQMGHHTAWPTMLYPQYQTKLSFGKNDFQVTPYLHAGLIILNQPATCNNRSIKWRGFGEDYREQFLQSMQP